MIQQEEERKREPSVFSLPPLLLFDRRHGAVAHRYDVGWDVEKELGRSSRPLRRPPPEFDRLERADGVRGELRSPPADQGEVRSGNLFCQTANIAPLAV